MSLLDDDPYWRDTAAFLEGRVGVGASLLAPAEFLERFPGTYHYHVDYLFRLNDFDAVVVHKGMAASFDRGFLLDVIDRLTPAYANDVFVVFEPSGGVGAAGVDEIHVAYLRDRIAELGPEPEPPDRITAVVVKTFERPWALERSLAQIAALGAPVLVVDDGSGEAAAGAHRRLAQAHGSAYVALPENRGAGCAMNIGVCYWLADPAVEWISIFEDDIDVRADTFAVLARVQDPVARPLLTGLHHPSHIDVGRAEIEGVEVVLTRRAISAHLHAHREYWRATLPAPSPYLGAPKPEGGRPGQGSDSDWWISSWSPNSVAKTGGQVVCVPGLVEHFGDRDSTWSQRG